MWFYFLQKQFKQKHCNSNWGCLAPLLAGQQPYHPTRTCSSSAEWKLGRSRIRYEMSLRVDNEHSKTFSNVVLVCKLSTLITSQILPRCCQSYFEQILPICTIWLFPLFSSKKRIYTRS